MTARAACHRKTFHSCRKDRFDFSSTASGSISVPGDFKAETFIGVGDDAGYNGPKQLLAVSTPPVRRGEND
jgi:hypothetical protein